MAVFRIIAPALVLVVCSCLPREQEANKTQAEALEEDEGDDSSSDEDSPPKSRPKAGDQRQRRLAHALRDPLISAPFTDDFERQQLGADWRATGSGWDLDDGQLCGARVRNHPLWLARRIPINARIEFDAVSRGADGDIKVEVWGDGASAATGTSYSNATSYLAIFGGWKNRYHVLARLDEHGDDRKALKVDDDAESLPKQPVEIGRTYRFRIERSDGKTVVWAVDGVEIHRFEDPKPLVGPGHDHVGFNDWEVKVCFDNLVITPL